MTCGKVHIPDECAIILSEVKRTLEAQVVQCLAECLDGVLGERLQALIQNSSIFTLQQAQKTNLHKEQRGAGGIQNCTDELPSNEMVIALRRWHNCWLNSRMAQITQAIQNCMRKGRFKGVWPLFLLKTAEFSSQLVVINGPHPGVWPEVFIKTNCALTTSAFGLAHGTTSSPLPIPKSTH